MRSADAQCGGDAPAGCRFVSAAEAAASGGIANVDANGIPLPAARGDAALRISGAAQTIPRCDQPALTPSQRRILICSYRLAEAGAEISYAVFAPSNYCDSRKWPLLLCLHGNGLTPLQQMLFDGLTDCAEKYGFVVAAPMGYQANSGWGLLGGSAATDAAVKPDNGRKLTLAELAQLDILEVLRMTRQRFAIDGDRLYVMGHSIGGAAACYLGAKHPELWAGIAVMSGVAFDARHELAAALRSTPLLVMQGEADPIFPKEHARHCVIEMRKLGLQHLYLEFPGKEHEFWIRRGGEHLEKVFMFFSLLSRRTNPSAYPPE